MMTAELQSLKELVVELGGRFSALEQRFEAVREEFGQRLEAVEDRLGKRLEAVENRIERLEERFESAIHTLRLDVEELRNDLSYARRLGGVPAARRPVRPQMSDGSGLLSGARDELVDIPPYVE